MAFSSDLYRCAIVIPMKSGITADQVVLDMHFSHAGAPSATDFDNLGVEISHFFTTTATGAANPLSYYLSGEIDATTNHCQIRMYEVPTGGGRTGPPTAVRYFTMSGLGAVTDLPEEVAVCVSIEGDLTGIEEFGAGTRPRSSRRNRFYLGPLSSRSISADATTKRVYVAPALVDDAQKAAKKLYADAFGYSWNWRIVSPKLQLDFPVFATSVDNAFDTQRRRGGKAQARSWVSIV